MRHRRPPRRRITRTLGAAAGGLLGAACLPAATAFADDYTVEPSSTPETVTGIYGYGFDGADTAPPGVPGSIQGVQSFNYTDTTSGGTGHFLGLESSSVDGLNDGNLEVYVTSATSGVDAPPAGSVFDTYTFGDGTYENIYSAIPSATGDQISDTLVTPFGDYTIPTTFDAADVPVADAGGVAIGDGDYLVPATAFSDVTAVTGIAPIDFALQGTQLFDINNSLGNAFQTDVTTTEDTLGTYTEAVLVTQDYSGTVGTAAGDTPAVGSIFNTINLGGSDEVYSDLVGTNGGANVITDTLITPLGNYDIPVSFDAADADLLSNGTDIDLPDGDVIAPTTDLDYTGINGLPPVDVGVQGTQDFTFNGTPFDADVTNTLDMFNDSTETIYVTSSADPDLPTGSVIETVNWSDIGIENIYTDIVSATAGGANTITDTLVTPFGDFTIPTTLDAAAGLASDLFGSV